MPALAGLIRYQKLSVAYKYYIYTFWWSVFIEVSVFYVNKIPSYNWYCHLFNLFYTVHILLVLLIFYKLNYINKRLLFGIISTLYTIEFIDFLVQQRYTVLSKSAAASSLLIVALGVHIIATKIFFTANNLWRSREFTVILSIVFLSLFDVLNSILCWIFPISIKIVQLSITVYQLANFVYYVFATLIILWILPTKK